MKTNIQSAVIRTMTAAGSAVLRCVTVAADAPFPVDAVKHKLLLVGPKSAQIKKF